MDQADVGRSTIQTEAPRTTRQVSSSSASSSSLASTFPSGKMMERHTCSAWLPWARTT